MGIGARVQPQKAKLKKEADNDTLRRLQNTGTPEGHMSMTSHLNVIKKCGQKISKRGGVDYKNIQTVSITHTRNKEETGTLRNEINCGGIGTLKYI